MKNLFSLISVLSYNLPTGGHGRVICMGNLEGCIERQKVHFCNTNK